MSEQEIINAGHNIVVYGIAFILVMVEIAIARYIYIVFNDDVEEKQTSDGPCCYNCGAAGSGPFCDDKCESAYNEFLKEEEN